MCVCEVVCCSHAAALQNTPLHSAVIVTAQDLDLVRINKFWVSVPECSRIGGRVDVKRCEGACMGELS